MMRGYASGVTYKECEGRLTYKLTELTVTDRLTDLIIRAPWPMASLFFPSTPPETPLFGISFTALVASWPTVRAALCCSCSSVDRVRPNRSSAWIPPGGILSEWVSEWVRVSEWLSNWLSDWSMMRKKDWWLTHHRWISRTTAVCTFTNANARTRDEVIIRGTTASYESQWSLPSSAIFKWFSKLSASLSNAKPA